jgi:hypothetical protein
MPVRNGRTKSGSPREGATILPEVDARALAWWAESAHGLQGQRLAVIRRAGAGAPELAPLSSVGPEDELYFEVFTPEHSPPMVRPEKLVIKPPNGPEINLHEMPEADALFWTASAIEKFVFPYYYAQRLLDHAQMAKLLADYNSSTLVAILHVAPSKPYAIKDAFEVLTADGAARAKPQVQGLLEYVKTR